MKREKIIEDLLLLLCQKKGEKGKRTVDERIVRQGFDSVDMVELIIEIEDRYTIAFDLVNFEGLDTLTVSGLGDMIFDKLTRMDQEG